MESFKTPSPYKPNNLISAIQGAGFIDIRINKKQIIIKDANAGDRSMIQTVLDTHDPDANSPKGQLKTDILAIDLSAGMTPVQVEAALKKVIRLLRLEGLLK